MKTNMAIILIIILVCLFLSLILGVYMLASGTCQRYFTDSELEKAAKEQISAALDIVPDAVSVVGIQNTGKNRWNVEYNLVSYGRLDAGTAQHSAELIWSPEHKCFALHWTRY